MKEAEITAQIIMNKKAEPEEKVKSSVRIYKPFENGFKDVKLDLFSMRKTCRKS